jgi:hypothetical protein
MAGRWLISILTEQQSNGIRFSDKAGSVHFKLLTHAALA